MSAKQDHHHLISQISRASKGVGKILADNGLLVLAEDVNQIAALIKRGGSVERKFGRMQELVGTVRTGMEQAERMTNKGG